MLIFYLLLFALAFYKCRVSVKGFLAEQSVSRNTTDSIKGIFIWLVFLSHFSSYVTYTSAIDLAGYKISAALGQLIVACFLFYSGYGVCEAIQKKGSGYVKSFPKNRVAKTLLHFDLAVLLFLIIKLCFKESLTVKNVLLSFVGWESLGNSNWYIFVILVLYLITWGVFSLLKNNLKAAVFLVTVITGFFVIFLYRTRYSWWYDTAMCYVLGMWFSVFKDKIFKLVTKNNIIWCLCILGVSAIYYLLLNSPRIRFINFAALIMRAPVFCLIIALLLIKVCISNKILVFSGQYLFEIYILQRIPMILLKEWHIADFNMYVYFILCIVITIALALAFRYFTNKIDKLIFKK